MNSKLLKTFFLFKQKNLLFKKFIFNLFYFINFLSYLKKIFYNGTLLKKQNLREFTCGINDIQLIKQSP